MDSWATAHLESGSLIRAPLIGHFRKELDAHQANLFFLVAFVHQFFDGLIQVIIGAFHEIVEEIILDFLIHHLVDIIVQIEFGAAVDNVFHLGQQLFHGNFFWPPQSRSNPVGGQSAE